MNLLHEHVFEVQAWAIYLQSSVEWCPEDVISFGEMEKNKKILIKNRGRLKLHTGYDLAWVIRICAFTGIRKNI